MNFVFYHSGYNKNLPNLLVQSILKTNPGNNIIQVSDHNTSAVTGITKFIQFEADAPSYFSKQRCEFYAQLEITGPTVYLDTDMLVIKKLSEIDIFHNSNTVFCKRFWDGMIHSLDPADRLYAFRNQSLKEVWPYLACFIACRDNNFWKNLYKIVKTLPWEKDDWFADQHALKIIMSINSEQISHVSEQQYGCLPDQEDSNISAASILHFKGLRKNLIETYYHNILC